MDYNVEIAAFQRGTLNIRSDQLPLKFVATVDMSEKE